MKRRDFVQYAGMGAGAMMMPSLLLGNDIPAEALLGASSEGCGPRIREGHGHGSRWWAATASPFLNSVAKTIGR